MPMFTYQKTNRYFAQIGDGLEDVAAAELAELGGRDVKATYRGVYFNADQATLYRVNYLSRLCTRILAPLLNFDCHSSKYLHKTAMKLAWQQLLSADQTFAVAATVSNSKIRHSKYAALCLKDAIVDQFREQTGSRPNVDTNRPDLHVNLHIDKNRAVISIDTSGGSLHRRGYRQESVQAPMQETLAAAIVNLSRWDGSLPLIDPMCGSGTILAEALMYYCRIPAAYLRPRFGFEQLPDFSAATWQMVKKEANGKIRRLPEGLISGGDIAAESVHAAKANLGILPHGKRVKISQRNLHDMAKIGRAIIISNPPYGIRLERKKDISKFTADLGSFLKKKARGCLAVLYFGKKDLAGKIGLKPRWQKNIKNGGLDGILVKIKT